MRGALAAAAAVLGYVCVAHTLADAVARKDPAFAHRLAPGDANIAARLAISLSGVEATSADRQRADLIAREAVLRDATAVLAVVALGINAEVRGDRSQARRLFAYSQDLSRRVLQAQLWGIEDAVARNDVAEALRHYDIALRVKSASAADLLYPVLASATTDPAIRAELVKTLAANPDWAQSFIAYMAGRGPDPRTTAAFFLSLSRVGVPVPETARTPVINALIEGGFLDAAWRYFATTGRAGDRRTSRDPRFAFDSEAPASLDWTPINDGSVTTSIQGGVFDFAAPASIGGPLLQQLQLLPPGAYRIVGHSSGIEQEARARPYWVLTCRKGGRELGRVPLPNSADANGRFSGRFSVPPSCPVQMLMLVARPSDAVAGLSGRIDHVQLAPAR